MYSIQRICSIVNGQFLEKSTDFNIKYLLHDSRKVSHGESSLFFALKTSNDNGHRFINDAYTKGVRNFIVSDSLAVTEYQDSNIIQVKDTVMALQQLAAYHRSQFNIPVIGITGSNGKTVVKEWLYHLLKDDYNIVRSPKSYNSQIGVPISVWQMTTENTLAIFEAGISQPGEIEKLEHIIKPSIGVFTNLGKAHEALFASGEQKFNEKLRLFSNTERIISQVELLEGKILPEKLFSWGHDMKANVQVISIEKKQHSTSIEVVYNGNKTIVEIPFTDEASIENALNCLTVLLYLNVPNETLKQKFKGLHAVDMRLQLKHAINNCLLINDSYSADITSLKIALEFLQQQSSSLNRTVILSEFAETGNKADEVYKEISFLLKQYQVQKLIVIGEEAIKHLRPSADSSIVLQTYLSTNDFIDHFKSSQFFNEIILLKGARVFEFERIASLFEKKQHGTVLQINLNALVHNLKEYQKLLKPGTKVMAMVKAFSYGSGGAEIASVLQYHNVHYLGVAYADEGVELVKSGIRLPIMVMNAEEFSFQAIVEYNLQPVIYSFPLLQKFENYLNEQGLHNYPVHIEIETGMNRLGFPVDEVEKLANHFSASSELKIQSVFSHLSASEDFTQDEYTNQQGIRFQHAVSILQNTIPYSFIKHIANSAAILRHPHLHLDMVRLGIGLYGVETMQDERLKLQPVATLRSTIAQIKEVKEGNSVSYNRKWIAEKNSLIATVRIGYADGYSRRFGNGKGRMLLNGKYVPVVGSVCMDMTMIDITGMEDVQEGDDVIIFGEELSVQQLADWIQTIPYEIMTGVSQRVKRVYFHE